MLEIDKNLYKDKEKPSKTKKLLKWAFGIILAGAALSFSVTIIFNEAEKKGYLVMNVCESDKQAEWALHCIDRSIKGITARKRALVIEKCYNKSRKLFCKKQLE